MRCILITSSLFFFQAEDGIRDADVTGVQTCALPILGIRLIEPKNEGDLYTFHNGWWRGNRTSYVTLRQDTITIICFNNHNSQLAYKTKELAPRLGNYPFIKTNG